MKTEIESKWLEIDHDEFRAKLKKLGAKQVRPLTKMTRANFDFSDRRLGKKGGWVRLRDEGRQVTLSYKQVDDMSLTGTKETCLVVNDFATAVDLLEDIGLQQKSIQETRRESWTLDGADIELDEWPWLPTFMEIETKSEAEMANVARKLDLQMADAMHGSADFVYEKYYDVTSDEVNAWPEIRFSKVPTWLAKKRRSGL